MLPSRSDSLAPNRTVKLDVCMQVSSRPASASVQAAAQRLSQGKASLAQSLVEFDPALAPAMQYTFGNAFVCQVRLSALAQAGAASEQLMPYAGPCLHMPAAL